MQQNLEQKQASKALERKEIKENFGLKIEEYSRTAILLHFLLLNKFCIGEKLFKQKQTYQDDLHFPLQRTENLNFQI